MLPCESQLLSQPMCAGRQERDWPSPASKELRGPAQMFPHRLTPYRDRVQNWWRTGRKAWGRRDSQAQVSSILNSPPTIPPSWVLLVVASLSPSGHPSPLAAAVEWYREQDPGEQRGTHGIGPSPAPLEGCLKGTPPIRRQILNTHH